MSAAEVGPAEPELEIIDLTGDATDSEDEEEDYGDEEPADASSDGIEEASRAQLRATIFTVPEAHLRHVVAGLADTVPAVYRALATELLAVDPMTRVVIPRWETCANCGETYDVNGGEDEEECTFHPGDLEVDEAKFPDWDEDCHGPMDSAHNREEYPESFTWSCCDGGGMAGGCVTGKHSVAVPKKRRV
ncbi:hypothetical protein DFH07DRAFT_957519 [Mycena maculata]|uniref:C2H2-type domain-containing protein n=1 Tax=Mycena maculata TaxID=230809 RepID=A0AAD7NH07_9AGAR|nr:hypothetical protein DFH07DRAFT_957519 [Mycena maculata]